MHTTVEHTTVEHFPAGSNDQEEHRHRKRSEPDRKISSTTTAFGKSTGRRNRITKNVLLGRNFREQNRFDDKETASIKTETKQFNGMRIEEADKKLLSILYLALGNEGKKIFSQKFTQLKILRFSFKEF